MLVLMAGLPGSGKSTLAGAIASRISATILNKDEFRAAIFSSTDIEYSTDQDDFVMKLLIETAVYLLRRHPERVIVVDGRPFSRSHQIEEAIAAADSIGQPWRILECVCADESARHRLAVNTAAGHPAANRDYTLYQKIKSHFEEIRRPKLAIDTDQPLENCLVRALSYLNPLLF